MAEWLEQRRQSGAGLRLHPNLRAGPGPPGTLRARFAERREAENTLNPFTLPVKITHLLAEWTAFGKRVAVVDQPVEGFELPPKGSAESPPMDLVLRLEKGALGTVLGALGSSTGDVKVKATMTIEVDGVKADVDFTLGNEDIAPKVANVTPLTK
ncbi:hypothetical protein HK101_008022 [Irineochytrium annulatum]|nr:hypothetical protein HK101_008022 [Irineochytrium annulatum]